MTGKQPGEVKSAIDRCESEAAHQTGIPEGYDNETRKPGVSMPFSFRLTLGVIGSLLLFGGCANTEVVRLYDDMPAEEGVRAILWPFSNDEMDVNQAFVKAVDGMPISTQLRPIELKAGQHVATVMHLKFSPGMCMIGAVIAYPASPGGCMKNQGITSLEWVAEPGHSYMPFALQSCGRNWVWIEDTGQTASYDVDKWQGHASIIDMAPILKFVDDVRRRDPDTRKVVSGTHPPIPCDPTN